MSKKIKKKLSKIKDEIFEIEFLQRIKISQFFLFKIEITCNKTSRLDVKNFNCNAGVNCNLLGIDKLNNYYLLQNQVLKKNEILTGYIAFQKTEMSTNQPIVKFKDSKSKIRGVKEVEHDYSNRVYSYNKSSIISHV